MNVLLAGQKWFGAEVYKKLRADCAANIIAVSSPVGGDKEDRLTFLAGVDRTPIIPAGSLNAQNMPDGVDLIVAAHSHDFIGEKTRLRATFGGIGYHPSLLPLHRGRDAVRWSVRMRERVTGGTVYRLSNRMDGGNVLAQKHVLIYPGESAESLWRRALAPMGVDLLARVVRRVSETGFINGTPQDESLATWEPSIDRPPAFKPDLCMISMLG